MKAIDTIIEDKDVRDDLRAGVKVGLTTAGNIVKWSAISIGVGVAIWLVWKLTESTRTAISNKFALDEATKKPDTSKCTISVTEARNLATRLYNQGFDQDAVNKFWSNFDEEVIKSVLNSLNNENDFLLLVREFGNKEVKADKNGDERGQKHNLMWFLGRDDASDIAEYQSILASKNINIKI